MKLIYILRSLGFYLFFYVGSVIHVLLALLLILIAPTKMAPVAESWSRSQRLLLRLFVGIDVKETGIQPQGAVLFAFKHESFFEAIDLPGMLNRPAGFAKQELFRVPGWGRVAAQYGLIPVERSDGSRALRKMVVEARRVMGEGRPLVIFPEGTRVPHGERVPLQSGFAALYKLLGMPVVPVSVDSGLIFGPLWKKPGTIHVHFGEVIEPGLSRAEIERRVIEAINVLNP